MTEDIPWRLAIDFGTSNTAAAVVQGNGGVYVLRLGARSDAIPSCVAAYSGEILTGDAALRIAGIYPSAFEPTPKRRLGEDAVVLGGSIFDPVDLVAAVLRYVLLQSTRFAGGGSPAQVILTHPEAWDEYLKRRLTAAAIKAGIPEQRIVLLPEPVAAGWHYAASSDVGVGAHVAVLDFGGGTCDAAVLKLEQTPAGPAFHVVAAGGIDPLGGHDFDAQLEGWVYAQLAAEGKNDLLHGLQADHSGADRAVLRDQIREAKHALSFHGSAPIGVHSGEHEWVCTVTRGEFEQLIERQLSRAVDLVQRVIQDALPSVQQLHRVYLTGGSSHIPALQSRLGEILPTKLGLMGDPKQITSIGALQAPLSHERASDPGTVAPWHETVPPAGNPGGKRKDGVRSLPRGPGTPPLAVSSAHDDDSPHPLRAPKKALIGAGIGAAVILLLATVALASGGIGPIGTPTGTSSGPITGTSPGPITSTPPSRQCAGLERPDFSDNECALLTSAADRGAVAADSCTTTKELGEASHGLVCTPPANSGFSAKERPTIFVYGYPTATALNKAFDGIIDQYGAAERPATTPPGWQTWHFDNDATQAVKGRLLGAAEGGTNYLVWTDEESLMEAWAISDVADVARLFKWWKK